MTDADRNPGSVMNDYSTTHTNVNWMLDELVAGVGAQCAVALSTDGILIQKSARLGKDDADHRAAIASTLSSVARGTGQRFGGGPVRQTIVEMQNQYLIVTAAGRNACLALLADVEANLGMIGYEMNRLVKRVGQHLASEERGAALASADGSPRV
jgi:predicted regulator of Ras-like GTPase activity (Roadblock/LC7/MglB family)